MLLQHTSAPAQSGDLTERHLPACVGKLVAILLRVLSSSAARLVAPAETKIPNPGKLRLKNKPAVKLDEKGESDEEIRKCPQEFKKPEVVPAKWNDRGWSSHNGVRSSA
jgi:hypothetical protein